MVYIKFLGGNGYCGCGWEEYMEFEEYDKDEFDGILSELSYEYAQTYEYVATGWSEHFESEEEEEYYYAGAMENANWVVISKEEYEENVNG